MFGGFDGKVWAQRGSRQGSPSQELFSVPGAVGEINALHGGKRIRVNYLAAGVWTMAAFNHGPKGWVQDSYVEPGWQYPAGTNAALFSYYGGSHDGDEYVESAEVGRTASSVTYGFTYVDRDGGRRVLDPLVVGQQTGTLESECIRTYEGPNPHPPGGWQDQWDYYKRHLEETPCRARHSEIPYHRIPVSIHGAFSPMGDVYLVAVNFQETRTTLEAATRCDETGTLTRPDTINGGTDSLKVNLVFHCRSVTRTDRDVGTEVYAIDLATGRVAPSLLLSEPYAHVE